MQLKCQRKKKQKTPTIVYVESPIESFHFFYSSVYQATVHSLHISIAEMLNLPEKNDL